MSIQQQQILETQTWQKILKNLHKAAATSLIALNAIDNPILDKPLLDSTRSFLKDDFSNFLKNKGEDCGWILGIGKHQRMVKKIPNKMGGKYD